MELGNISARLKEIAVGTTCNNCLEDGVRCGQNGFIIQSHPGFAGQSVAYVDDRPILRFKEPIRECPALTGENSQKEVVEKIKSNAEAVQGGVFF